MANKKIKYAFISALLLSAVFVSPSAFALGDPWTAVASAGEADEADQHEVVYSAGTAGIAPALSVASTVLRYNITSTADLNDGGTNLGMRVRFRDNGSAARVIVRLRRYNLNNGTGATLFTLDSDNYAPSAAFQTQTVTDSCAGLVLDFENNAYFIEATLTRSNTAGTPNLGILQVFNRDIC